MKYRGLYAQNCLSVCMGWCGLCALLLLTSGCATTTTPKWEDEPYPTAQQEISADTPPPVVDDSGEPIQPAASPETEAVQVAGGSSAATQVVLQPYDAVRIRFLYWPELDDEQIIRPDGKISLLMVGDIEAQGKTPFQLQQDLLRLYEPLLNNPEINVVVSTLASNRVYVFGSVLAPGLIPLEGKLTLLGAIAQAGGFMEPNANKSMVVVVRDVDGEQYARSVNLKSSVKNPTSATFYLEPYDIVYVPETTITKMNQFVAQYIDGIIPDHIRFGASYSLGGRSTRVSTNQTSPWQRLPAINFNTGN